jgi:hypothetical protein
MKNKISQRDPIKTYKRKATAARRVGQDARCTYCGEARPEALNLKSKPITCEECHRKRRGKTTMDQHHIAGRANSPITTSIPANDHRAELSVAQQEWPKEVRENPDGCPLLRAAAHILGFVDTVIHYMREFLLWIADLLIALSAHLAQAWGRKWWLKSDLKRFARHGVSDGKA